MDELTQPSQESIYRGFSDYADSTTLGAEGDLPYDDANLLPLGENGFPEGVEVPPTEDELPYSDGEPMESNKHHLQMVLLIQTLEQYYTSLGRDDVAVHGNMAVYFSIEQAQKQNFCAPDFFLFWVQKNAVCVSHGLSGKKGVHQIW